MPAKRQQLTACASSKAKANIWVIVSKSIYGPFIKLKHQIYCADSNTVVFEVKTEISRGFFVPSGKNRRKLVSEKRAPETNDCNFLQKIIIIQTELQKHSIKWIQKPQAGIRRADQEFACCRTQPMQNLRHKQNFSFMQSDTKYIHRVFGVIQWVPFLRLWHEDLKNK